MTQVGTGLDVVVVVRPIRDDAGRVVDAVVELANEPWRAAFVPAGVDPVGRGLVELVPELADRLPDLVRAVETGLTVHGTHPMPGDPARSFVVQLTPDGERVIVVAHEATRERDLEVALEETEARFGAALDVAPDAFALLRPIFDADGRYVDAEITYANRVVRDRWFGGAPLERIVGRRHSSMPPVLRDQSAAIYRSVAETGATFQETRRFAAPTGETWLEMRVARFVGGFVHTSRDVTAAHVAETALRESEARFGELVDRVPVGVHTFRVHPDGSFSFDYLSPQFGRILGIDPEAAVRDARVVFDAVHPDDVEGLVDGTRAAALPDRSFGWEGRFVVRGETRVIRLRSELGTVDGDDLVWHGFIEDVTDRRRAEEALRVSEERHRLIAENALDVIWTMAPDGRITYVSPSVEKLRGYTVDEAMAQPLEEILTPESGAASVAYFGYVLGEIAAGRRPDPYRGEQEYLCADGSTLWCDVRAYPILAPDGTLVELLGVSRDVGERKRHEDELLRARDAAEAANHALLQANADLAGAQRLAHVGSWRYDPATDVSTWSDELYRIFGLPPDRPVPLVAESEQLYAPESWTRLTSALDAAVRSATPYEIALEVIRPDGRRRHTVSRGEAVLDADGTVVALHGTLIDVTELVEAQARLDQAQRSEMVGRLAGGVAHDFNNILAAINGFAEFLTDGIPADDPLHDDAVAIREAGSRAAALTRQLLAFGRRQTLLPTVLDPREVVDGLLPMLRSLVSENVGVVVRSRPAGRVRVDRTQLEQAIVNLVLNARDAMPGGGRVTIDIADEVVAEGDPRLRPPARPGAHVVVSVTDTGTGIDPEVLPHVFEPFFTTKELGRGTGLGLSSVEGTVLQSGGFVTAESAIDAGSVFSIFLPRAGDEPPREEVHTARPDHVAADRPATVLFVEDDASVRRVVARTLRDVGYDVIDLADPRAAIEAARGGMPFDVLVTDVVMPGMDGRALAERLGKLRPGMPVIFISGYAPETIFGSGLLPEGTPFLAKPFARAELAARIREVLGS